MVGEQMEMFDDMPNQWKDYEYDKSKFIVVPSDNRIRLPECPIAAELMKKVKQRADVGLEKYGVTMDRTDITTPKWIDLAIEEFLDGAAYLIRLKKDIAELEDIKFRYESCNK